jgi:hypothetical protein
LEIVDLREHTASGSTEGLTASSSRRRAASPPPENTPEVVKGSLSGFRYSKAGHDGEEEEGKVAHAPRTVRVGAQDEPIFESEAPEQRPAALHPTKTPAQRSNMSHESKLPSVNYNDGIALPTTSMQSEVSEPTELCHFEMLHFGVLLRQR